MMVAAIEVIVNERGDNVLKALKKMQSEKKAGKVEMDLDNTGTLVGGRILLSF